MQKRDLFFDGHLFEDQLGALIRSECRVHPGPGWLGRLLTTLRNATDGQYGQKQERERKKSKSAAKWKMFHGTPLINRFSQAKQSYQQTRHGRPVRDWRPVPGARKLGPMTKLDVAGHDQLYSMKTAGGRSLPTTWLLKLDSA
jgi:hypothetical protein